MLTAGLRTAAGMAEAITGGAVDVIGLARPLALQSNSRGCCWTAPQPRATSTGLHRPGPRCRRE